MTESVENATPAPEPTTAEAAAEPTPQPAVAEPAEAAAPDQTAAEPTTAEPATEPTVAEPAAEGAPEPESPAAERARPKPAPKPRAKAAAKPRPTPKAVPRPPSPEAAPPAHDAQDAAQAAAWGRVAADGTVWVRESGGERSVGQYPGADAKEALAFYVVRFLDLQAQVDLLEVRMGQLGLKELDASLEGLQTGLKEPAAVGDLDGLRARLAALEVMAKDRRAQVTAEREAAREQAVAARTQIVERVEAIAGGDPTRTQWRQAGEQLRSLLEEWKNAQRHGPRIDRPTEDALWKRFSAARSTFDKGRRQFFAELEQSRAAAKAAKEELIAKAEELSRSTSWGPTAAAFRSLMEEWKAAGRAAHKEDDALWERFRAAQDAFFAARNAAGAAVDQEYAKNLEVKLALLAEAEALVPVKDVSRARSALRGIQDRWDAAGKVPRGDLQRIEGRLRAVETAVRDAGDRQWTRRNPDTQARSEGLAAQLEAAIAGLEADLAAAEAGGDKSSIRQAREALEARKAWLAQARRTAKDLR